MGKAVLNQQPCPVHGGSDSVTIYEDGSAYCWNGDCNKSWRAGSYNFAEQEFQVVKKGSKRSTMSDYTDNDGLGPDDDDGDVINFGRGPSKEQEKVAKIRKLLATDDYEYRKVSEKVVEFYNCRIAYNASGDQESIYYGYNLDSDGNPQGYKQRVLPKDFSKGSAGPIKGTFGRGLFSGGKRIVITEGEDDCLVVQEAYYRKHKTLYPVISLRSSTSTKDLIEERESLRQFDEVILWMDNDEPGQKAMKEAAKIIGYDKVKVVKCAYNDAGEALKEVGYDKLLRFVYDAVDYSPAGILTSSDLWERVVTYNEKPSISYPAFMAGLNEKLGGIRFGEITLWTSGTGSGKSTLMREIMLHLANISRLVKTGGEFIGTESYNKLIEMNPSMKDYIWESVPKIGVVTLEESPEETARKMSGMALNRNPSAEKIELEELKEGYDMVFGDDDNIMVLDHQGSISDGSVLEHLEFMCLKGAKWLFVDHITILVSEGVDGLTGNEAIDKMMNELARLVKKYDVWIGLISHLRKAPSDKKSFEEGRLPSLDDIKGSGSIKQIAFDVIGFARNQASDDEEVRNIVKTKVLKCRYTGKTGPSGNLQYNYQTGRMTSTDMDPDAMDEGFNKTKKFEEV